jgi:hypothetical protein
MYGFGSDFSGGINGLPSNMGGALGYAPTGIYSGLDPSASAGAYGGNPLGGGAAGQASGAPSSSGMSPLAQMMLMQQATQAAQQIGQQAPVQATGQQQYANPQAQVTPGQGAPTINPAMLGRISPWHDEPDAGASAA